MAIPTVRKNFPSLRHLGHLNTTFLVICVLHILYTLKNFIYVSTLQLIIGFYNGHYFSVVIRTPGWSYAHYLVPGNKLIAKSSLH